VGNSSPAPSSSTSVLVDGIDSNMLLDLLEGTSGDAPVALQAPSAGSHHHAVAVTRSSR
jgi:hypothetical protein